MEIEKKNIKKKQKKKMISFEKIITLMITSHICTYDLFGWRGKRWRVEGSKVKLAKNKLICT